MGKSLRIQLVAWLLTAGLVAWSGRASLLAEKGLGPNGSHLEARPPAWRAMLGPWDLPGTSWASQAGTTVPELEDPQRLHLAGLGNGNFLPAIQAYREAMQRADHPPWAGEALFRIAEGFHRMRHFQEAVSYWPLALKGLPPGPLREEAHLAWAEGLFLLHDLAEALRHFDVLSRTLPAGPGRIWALYRCGDCMAAGGDEAGARARFAAAREAGAPPAWIPPESLENMARLASKAGEAKEARSLVMTAASLHPLHPRHATWLDLVAQGFLDEGKALQAGIIWDRLLQEHPMAAEAPRAKVRAVGLERRCFGPPVMLAPAPSPVALTDPRSGLYQDASSDPLLQGAVLDLVTCLLERGDGATAVAILAAARRRWDGTPPAARARDGLRSAATAAIGAALASGEPAQAVIIFQEASFVVREMEEDVDALGGVARALEALGFEELAADLYGRVLQQGPASAGYGDAVHGLLRVHAGAGRADAALALLGKVPDDRPWKATAEKLLRWAATDSSPELGRLVAGWLVEAQEAKRSVASLMALGRWAAATGAHGQELDILKENLGSMPPPGEDAHGWTEVWSILGDLQAGQGRPLDALAAYERALTREPWGALEKWSAFEAIRHGIQAGAPARVRPLWDRLAREPEGSMWRRLAEYLNGQAHGAVSRDREGKAS